MGSEKQANSRPIDQTAGPLPRTPGGWRCIVADPPWPMQCGIRGHERSWGKGRNDEFWGYPVMSAEDIAAIPVAGVVAKNAHLWLWRLVGRDHLEAASREVAHAWGFKPVAAFIWIKGRIDPSRGIVFHRTMSPWLHHVVECGLFCVRGMLPPLVKGTVNAFVASARWKGRRHGTKPKEFFKMVEAVSPGPRLELFAREQRPGWRAWGNEV